MQEALPSLEYSPQHLHGALVIRKSDAFTSIIIRQQWKNILVNLRGTAAWCVIVVVCLVFLQSGARAISVGHVLPLIFFGTVILQICAHLWLSSFPITIEVHPDHVNMKWRTLTEIRSQSWPRNTIRRITAEKIRIKNHYLKRWLLVFQTPDHGKLAVMHGTSEQLQLTAQILREALGHPDDSHPATRIAKPRKCSCVVTEWAGGILLAIPSRHGGWIKWTIALLASCAGIAIFLFIGSVRGWDDIDSKMAYAAMAGISLILAMCSYWILAQLLQKAVPLTNVLISSQRVQVLQTGIFNPLNVSWNPAELKEIYVQPGNRFSNLVLIPLQGLSLTIAEKRRDIDMQFAANVIQCALAFIGNPTPLKTVSTANAAPPPAHTAQPASDPALK